MNAARVVIAMWLIAMVAGAALGVASAQAPNRLGGGTSPPAETNQTQGANSTAANASSNETAPTANTTNTTQAPAGNESTGNASTPPPSTAPDGTSITELGSTGMMVSGDFVVDVCLKSYRSFSRPYECAFASNQRIYDRYWFIVHANKPFKYVLQVDGQVVAEGESAFRLEWNSSTTKQSINFRLDVTEVGGSSRSVQYVFENMRVRATGAGGEDDEDVDGGSATEDMVPARLVAMATTKAVVGACIAFLIGMPLAYAYWEEKDARMSAELILGG